MVVKNRKLITILCSVMCAGFLTGCDLFEAYVYSYTTTSTEKIVVPEKVVTYRFVDEQQNPYEINANPNVKALTYNKAAFLLDGDRMSYGEKEYDYRFGIDVSYYQGEIDWKKVANDGVEFAMIRLGYRGWSDGMLHMDECFVENIQGAQDAGIDVGVYFFTQAVNETEARAEAEYVISKLQNYELQLPIACDVEDIDDGVGRMDNISVSQRTRNVAVFCQTLKSAGYDAMIYCNMYYEAYKLDLELLSGVPIWYADYSRFPQTPYHFDIWQYKSNGRINGIKEKVDLNIQMMNRN